METLPIDITVTRLQDGRATLATASGHEFHWPAAALPAACVPGDRFCFDYHKVHSITLEDTEKTCMGRALLNELLTAPPS